jgi:hypothetical protein
MAAGLLALLAVVSFRHGQDFLVFWRAAQRLTAGTSLFPPGEFLAWRYAPGTALIFWPFAILPFPLAKAAWFALLVGVGALLVRDLASAVPDPRPTLTSALAIAALSRPMVEEFACGQVNLIVLFLLMRAFRAEDEGHPIRAGLLLSVAVGLKLAPAAFLLDAVLRRRWRELAGAALGAIAIAAAPLPFYGLAGDIGLHAEWVHSLATASPALAAAGGNQSVFGLTARLGGPAWCAIGLAGLVLVLALLRRGSSSRRASLLFATAIASPMGWIQNYVMALPAAFAIARTRGRYVAAAGLLLLVPMYDVSGPRFEHWFFDHSLPLAAMALLFIAGWTKEASEPPARPSKGTATAALGR